MKILYVEDEIAVRRSITDTLSHRGYHVIEFSHPYNAIQFIESGEAYDLLLTDLFNPSSRRTWSQDGDDLVKTSKRVNKGTPVIVLTGASAIPTEERRKQKINRVLHKPIRTNRLVEAIESLVQ